MKKLLLSLFIIALGCQPSFAQNNPLDQNFLFDDSDIIIRAQEDSPSLNCNIKNPIANTSITVNSLRISIPPFS